MPEEDVWNVYYVDLSPVLCLLTAGAAEMRKQKVSEVHNTSSSENDEEGYVGRRLTLSEVMTYSKV